MEGLSLRVAHTGRDRNLYPLQIQLVQVVISSTHKNDGFPYCIAADALIEHDEELYSQRTCHHSPQETQIILDAIRIPFEVPHADLRKKLPAGDS